VPLDDALAWIGAHVRPTGKVELVHERPWGRVHRVPVAGGVAWFKACAPVQAFEPRLTAALARRRPDLPPVVLGYEGERGWLLLGDAGKPLGFDVGPEPWLDILPRYAELQRSEAAQLAEHLDAGVPDRRIESFPGLYEAMLARELPIGSGDRERLRAFAPRFRELCDELASRGVPETVQHEDLHGANVYLCDGGPRILDWGDSCISHPFLTMYVAFVHIDRIGGLYNRLRDAYLEAWGRPDALRDTFELSYRLGPFAHLFKELRVFDAIPEAERARLSSTPNLPVLLADCVGATAP
jgi:phosphotransferase family enzyme